MDFRYRLEPKSAASPSLGKSVLQFGKEMLPGIFAGFVLLAGRGWSGDFLIADREDFENFAPSDIADRTLELFDIPQSQRAEMLARETFEEDGKGIPLLGETCIYACFPTHRERQNFGTCGKTTSKAFGPENEKKICG